jgi:hypothetical protein
MIMHINLSPTFNILDLCSYLGKEDEMSSRMTLIQAGDDDEDMTTHDASPHVFEGHITRARTHQLQL